MTPLTPSTPLDPNLLLESFLSIMRFERAMWELTFNVFLKNPMRLWADDRVHRGELLHLTAPNLFSCLEQGCTLTVLTGICSLLLDDLYFDEKKQTKPNLVLRRVVTELIPEGTPERASIDHEVDKAVSLAAPLNDSRNKLLAHNDLTWEL